MEQVITRITKGLEQLSARNKHFYRTVSLYYRSMIKKEIELANISASDKVLCIGGGPCPFSGILLHEYTGAKVTIVDNDDLCVRCSRSVINSLGYGDDISVLHGDGKEIVPKDYSVIHMAAQVYPLAQVLREIKRRCCLGTKILVRLPKKSLFKAYGIEDVSFLNNCELKTFHSRVANVESTYLVTVN